MHKKDTLENDSFGESDDTLITETGVSYRDRVSVLDKKGKRIRVCPVQPKGRYHRARLIVGYFLMAIFFVLPFIKYNGNPYFLLDVISRKFILFGSIWYPHDFYIFAIGFLAFAIFIVLFTAVFGRIWCGWACPQTVFMELVYRKIEYFIEGNASKQRVLNKAPLTPSKFFKKFTKHTIFLVLSFILNIIVLSYIISIDGIYEIFFVSAGDNIGGITANILVTLACYLNYSWFREQACTFVCPYGRLQSVLLDKNSIIVAYDDKRGEPRGKMASGHIAEGNGDCIDCGACVRVCPTGIDIRNGLQLECVNCTACIDSCDEIMDNIKKPRGLIRYTSIINIEQGKKFTITPRIILYTILLAVLLTVFISMSAVRTEVEATILRAKGSTFIVNDNGNIMNLYTVKMINKGFNKLNLSFKTEDMNSKFTLIGTNSLVLEPESILEGTFLLEIPQEELKPGKNEIEIVVYSNGKKIEEVKTIFEGVNVELKKDDDDKHEDDN